MNNVTRKDRMYSTMKNQDVNNKCPPRITTAMRQIRKVMTYKGKKIRS